MHLDIRLLGPLEVAVDGRPVRLASRLRAVLAVLAMFPERTVPVDRIVDALWDQAELPSSPRASVQTYIARLRGVFGADLIVTDPAGYTLRAGPMQVDAARFAALLDEAAAACEPERERARLAEALRLWRGRPFEGVESAWLHGKLAPRLVERHLAAVERRVDLDLAAGGSPGDLAAELRELCTEHPLREPLWARLLEVLRRCGRQAEALEAYEKIRRRLAEELGTDPGAGLRAIHAQLLGSTTTVAPPEPAIVGTVVPRQLPADVVGFTGREHDLSALDRMSAGGAGMPILAIGGPAGVGKTTLAVHWAHRVAGQFPDGQLYANLRGFEPTGALRAPGEVVRGFLEALQVSPHEVPAEQEAQFSLFRSLLAGRRVLVVLDNARNAEQVRPLLPGSSGCLVLVTSRDRLSSLVAVEGARPVPLDVLAPQEARRMVANRLGAARVRAEPEAAGDVVNRCAGLPLALAVVAARAALRPDVPLRTVVRELDEAASKLDSFADTDPVGDVRAVFSWSYRTLSPDGARLFGLLGLHPGPDVGTDAVASLAGLAVPKAKRLLAELVSAQLLTEDGHDRYWHHDLLHAYAAEQAAQEGKAGAVRRVLDHYLHSAHKAARLLDPNRDLAELDEPLPGVSIAELPDRDAAMAWLDTEHRCLQKAIGWAGTAGFDSHVCRLTVTLVGYWDLRGRWHDAMNGQRLALGAAVRLGDPAEEARIRGRLSRACTMLHRHDEAQDELRRSLEISRELGDLRGQAVAHHHLAFLLGRLGRHREALEQVGQELELARAAGHRRTEAMALNGIGWFHALLGELELADEHCRAALEIHDELGNRSGEASTWDSLGYVRHRQGKHHKAVECYERSLERRRQLGDDFFTAETLLRMGDAYAAAGETGPARAAWQEAWRLFTALGRTEAGQADARLKGLESEIASG